MFLSVQSFFRPTPANILTRISTAADDSQADGRSDNAHFSPDGRFVIFQSNASNLVSGDTNNDPDIFLKDLITGAVTRLSTKADGTQGDSYSSSPQLSPDGRYLLFYSGSSLVDDDTNHQDDIFLKNLATGQITRVSTKADGTQSNGNSSGAQFSSDGRFVVFQSTASDLVAGDTNSQNDIFLKNLATGEITRVSTAADGTQADGRSQEAILSKNGRYVLLNSEANNLVNGDTNGFMDVFRKDLITGEITRVSTAADGAQGNGRSYMSEISADGRYVVFQSGASNLVPGDTNGTDDIFRKDLLTGEITLLSTAADGTQANSFSWNFETSPNGRYALFTSNGSNLVAGDTNNTDDIFRVDLFYKANAAAITQGRYIETTLGVGSASGATIAWGDGTSSTVTPAGGSAAFSHTYASAGAKAATVILTEGALTWNVAHTIDTSTGTMMRNTTLADTLTGGAGNDVLTGDAFANILIANAGNDRLSASSGNDHLDAGSGNDALYGGTENDTLVGSSGNDRLNGETGNDSLDGGSGNDVLSASSGNDRLSGGAGKDSLTGGSGRDSFVFDDRETSSSKSKADYITDFSRRQSDRIDLSAIDANTKKRGDQKFSFIGDEKSFSKAGEVRFEKTKGYTYVYLNTDKAAEAVIKIKGALELQKSWFVL